MKSEDTIFDHEKSSSNKKTWQEREVLDKGAAKKMTGKEAPVSENSSTARNAITSMGFGVLLGAASSLATNYAFAVGTNDSQDNLSENQMSGHYDWVEDGVDIATSVKDDMTFSDAFAAARAEVGAGGGARRQLSGRGSIRGKIRRPSAANTKPRGCPRPRDRRRLC